MDIDARFQNIRKWTKVNFSNFLKFKVAFNKQIMQGLHYLRLSKAGFNEVSNFLAPMECRRKTDS